jgi:cell division protein FtsB
MGTRQNILIAVAVAAVVVLFFMIVFGDNGLADLRLLKNKQGHLQMRNAQLARENVQLHRQIDRLKHDPAYIESIARQELGMIAPDEIIIKPRSGTLPK